MDQDGEAFLSAPGLAMAAPGRLDRFRRREDARRCFCCWAVVPPGEQWAVAFNWLLGGHGLCAVCAESWSRRPTGVAAESS